MVLSALAATEAAADAEVLAEFERELLRRAAQLPTLSLSSVTKAFARLGYRAHGALLDAVVAAADAKLARFGIASLSDLLWGLAAFERRDAAFLQRVEKFACVALELCTEHQVASITESLRAMGHRPNALAAHARQLGFEEAYTE